MNTAICTECEASISWTEASRSDPPACPFCGADVQEQDFSSPEDPAEAVDEDDELAPDSDRRKIQIVEQSPDRLLLAIEAAGRGAMSIVFFAIIWNAVSWIVAIAFFSSGDFGKAGPFSIVPFLGVGLFVAAGAFFIAWAVKAAFGRALVLVEKNRASVQTILFGWKRTRSTEIGPASLAALEEAYQQNNVPVYRVKITGPNGAIRFGTALPHADKLWAVSTINRFLSPAGPGAAAATSRPLHQFEVLWRSAETATSVAPTNLSPGSLVRIVDSQEDRLEFSLPLLPKRAGFVGMSLVFIGLSLTVGFVWSAGFADGGEGSVVFLLPFFLVLLLQATACLAIFRGRITVTVDTEGVSVRWHLGPVGPSKSLPIASVDHVAVIASGEAMRHLALVGGGSTSIPLTTLHDRTTDEEVAGLVRWQLERLGHTLR